MTLATFLLLWILASLLFTLAIFLASNNQTENVCLNCGRAIQGGESALCGECLEQYYAGQEEHAVCIQHVVEPGDLMQHGSRWN